MGVSDRAAARQIAEHHRAWLRSLPATATVAQAVLLCHGTPARDVDYLLEGLSASGANLASREQIRAALGAAEGTVLCGHSHVPRLVRLADGTVVVNPGSVGLQAYYDSDHHFPHAIENGSPHARYALLDRIGSGWRVTFRAIEYDWDAAARIASDGGRQDWAHALATGYALRQPT